MSADPINIEETENDDITTHEVDYEQEKMDSLSMEDLDNGLAALRELFNEAVNGTRPNRLSPAEKAERVASIEAAIDVCLRGFQVSWFEVGHLLKRRKNNDPTKARVAMTDRYIYDSSMEQLEWAFLTLPSIRREFEAQDKLREQDDELKQAKKQVVELQKKAQSGSKSAAPKPSSSKKTSTTQKGKGKQTPAPKGKASQDETLKELEEEAAKRS